MTSINNPDNIPAERTHKGVAIQKVNLFEPGTGRFIRQVTYPGTEKQARAYALLQVVHDTDPLFPYLMRVLRGEE